MKKNMERQDAQVSREAERKAIERQSEDVGEKLLYTNYIDMGLNYPAHFKFKKESDSDELFNYVEWYSVGENKKKGYNLDVFNFETGNRTSLIASFYSGSRIDAEAHVELDGKKFVIPSLPPYDEKGKIENGDFYQAVVNYLMSYEFMKTKLETSLLLTPAKRHGYENGVKKIEEKFETMQKEDAYSHELNVNPMDYMTPKEFEKVKEEAKLNALIKLLKNNQLLPSDFEIRTLNNRKVKDKVNGAIEKYGDGKVDGKDLDTILYDVAKFLKTKKDKISGKILKIINESLNKNKDESQPS